MAEVEKKNGIVIKGKYTLEPDSSISADEAEDAGIVIKDEHNEFELALRFLGNELIAVKMKATNFSGKLIVWSILLLLFSFLMIEIFEVDKWLGG